MRSKSKLSHLRRPNDLTPEAWQPKLGLYPFPLSMVFDRKLHFVARLAPTA